MKIYADKFVDSLKNTEEIIEVYGSEVVLKRSPAEVRKGYLDPYEAAALDKSEKHVGEKNEGDLSLDIMARKMRDSMGFPNLNLNTAEMITKFEKKIFEGNAVELWRYYKRRSNKNKRSAFLMIHGCRTDFADIQNKKECRGNRQWQRRFLKNWAADMKGKAIT